MPNKEFWDNLQATNENKVFSDNETAIQNWAKDAESLVNFFQNEMLEMNSTEYYMETYPVLGKIGGDVVRLVLKCAVNDYHLDFNTMIDERSFNIIYNHV